MKMMASSNSPSSIVPAIILNIFLLSASFHLALGQENGREGGDGGGSRGNGGVEVAGGGRRVLMSFKETPRGSNVTFECSPSGPCIACAYSEKKDEKYRCSETGYRIPLECVDIEADSKDTKQKPQKTRSALEVTLDDHVVFHEPKELPISIRHRSLLDDSSSSEGKPVPYITYRSCIPAVNEEKLSVLGFEGIVLFLLVVGGSVVLVRRKRTAAVSGAVRLPTNSRF